MIHQTAIVSPKADIHLSVEIGPYCVVADDVKIGEGSKLFSHVVIDNGARIGKNVNIFSGAIISTAPQDLKYKGEPTEVFVGDDTVIREYVTINRGTTATGKTIVGKNTLVMAYSHVAHDCVVGDNVVISNVSQLAGHVHIQDWVVLGGMAKITQFCVIGKHAMIGADVKIVKDVAPFTLLGRDPAQVEGINKVGLRRRGFDKETIDQIELFYDTILFSGLNNRDGINKFKGEKEHITPDVVDCIAFIEKSTRGIHR